MAGFLPFAGVLEDLGWPHIIAALADATTTERGRERALRLPFLDSPAEVEDSLARVEEARTLMREDDSLPLGAVADVGAALERAAKGGTLPPETILLAAELIRAAARMRRFLLARRAGAPRLSHIASGLADLSGLAARIEEAFEPSGELKDTASDALAGYRSRARQLHRELKDRVEDMLHDSEIALFVQDSYYSLRNDRYVLPIQASFRSQVPGIVHNASQSGQTLFIEPQQIVDLGNELSIAESLAAEEERQILAEFSSYVGDRADDLADAMERLAALDVVNGSARLAERMAAEPFAVSAGTALALHRLRHPLLVLQNKRVVANDVVLDECRRALVVSGPNAGGKTVTITAVGLSALMARAGLPLPAMSGSRVPLFDGVCSAMGDAQDLARDLSTFSAHLTALRDILAVARDGWLVVVDEIAADTDPTEGAALATATLEQLATQGAVVLVTTHLDEVKALGVTDERFENARVGLSDTLEPTYMLSMGAAGVSNAVEIARRVGLPDSVLARARERLETGGALSEALARLAQEQRAARAERSAAAEARAQVERSQAELVEQKRELEEARRQAATAVREELANEVEAARAEVRTLIAELQRQPKMARAQQVQRELAEQAQAIDKKRARSAAGQDGVPPAAADVPVGSRVRVVSLDREGEVLAVDEDAATVAVGSLRSRVPFDDLVVAGPPRKRGGKQMAPPRRRRDAIAAELDHPEAECDVRGMRSDEAFREMEAFLDRCSYAGPNVVVVIHGHGTGALKRAVRDGLEQLPYVASFRPGKMHEGGDGVTVVELCG
jgi:DNA mismatch repair protein MutS2